MSFLTGRNARICLAILLVILAVLAVAGNNGMGRALAGPLPSPPPSRMDQPTAQPTVGPTIQPSPTLFVLGPLFESDIDLRAGPIDVPLTLKIPSLDVDAPVLAVGLIPGNVMDAPKGPANDPVWHTAFWYRGGGTPGSVGTATIAGHVNDPLARPQIFAHLDDLKPGDVIIIHLKHTGIDIRFIVDEVKVYSLQEFSDPAVLTRVFGAGPVAGTGPEPASDGLSHLTLITCAGTYIHGQFDHRTVVFSTRSY